MILIQKQNTSVTIINSKIGQNHKKIKFFNTSCAENDSDDNEHNSDDIKHNYYDSENKSDSTEYE